MRWTDDSRPACRQRGAWFLLVYFLGVIVGLAALLPSCSHYNPSLYPSYDVLNPGEKVRKNPISTFADPVTGESMFVVTAEFIQWVAELKDEVLKLRKGK